MANKVPIQCGNADRSDAGPGSVRLGDRPDNRLLLVATPSGGRAAMGALRASPTPGEGACVVGWVSIGPEVGDGVGGPEGVEPLGTVADLERVLQETGATMALVSAPAAMVGLLERIRALLGRYGVAMRFWATLDDALGRDPVVAGWLPRIADRVDPLALLGRASRGMDRRLVAPMLSGRRVMITGAGGSIGSELARQCAAMGPGELILMERSDNALFEIDRELGALAPGVSRRAVLHDVVDAEATLRRFEELRPDVVFHAAAHKHVPLMEDHPAAAVTNNLFGTRSVADAALAVGVERFVMISTDKAVRPTSVMGATKRLAELYVRSLNGRGSTRFALVRFGNVLASACSVVPVWASQVSRGGPITVTDPRMTRYFMTIPEAASLVIQAGALVESGEPDVFVLDMGEPVSILALAERFAGSCGLRGVVDWSTAPEGTEDLRSGAGAMRSAGGAKGAGRGDAIGIVFTGVRPGEKLYEELAYEGESLVPTPVEGVRAWRGAAPSRAWIERMIGEMSRVRRSLDRDAVHAALRLAVPEWCDSPGQLPINVRTNGIPQADAA
ncbi:MAG: UDP-N-acetylglucosamine 4,6-dehydratase family protein [Phycisphaerales bacterium]